MKAFLLRLLYAVLFFLAGTSFVIWRMSEAETFSDVCAWFGVFVVWVLVGGSISALIASGGELGDE